jgi:hypothetical protein
VGLRVGDAAQAIPAVASMAAAMVTAANNTIILLLNMLSLS